MAAPMFKESEVQLSAPARLEIPPSSFHSLGRDAALPHGNPLQFSSSFEDWDRTKYFWQRQIDDEQLRDIVVPHYRTPTRGPSAMRLRGEDGALYLGKPTGADFIDANRGHWAYTPRAWAQMVALLIQEDPAKPRGAAEPFRWLWPAMRRDVFEHLVRRSRRPEGEHKPIVLRTFLDLRFGFRAVRAAVSGIHAGEFYDDAAVLQALDLVIHDQAAAWVTRTIDTTVGHAELGAPSTDGSARHVKAMLTWRNSETGAASLGFGAACRITVLDAIAREKSEFATDTTMPVTVASAAGATRRSHTVPRANRTQDERRQIADDRMARDIAKASNSARRLADAWMMALTRFPGGSAAARPASAELEAEIILDLIESRTRGFKAADREVLKKIIADERQLKELPFLSAAHLAGAWALAAKRAEDPTETLRLQVEAGRWILEVL